MRSNEEISRDMAGMTYACQHQGHGCTHPVCDCERPGRAAPPFHKGSWQHAVDDALVNFGRTSEEFATPHEAVQWLLSIERDAPIACLSVTPECRESGCAAARNAGVGGNDGH